jgi:Protein of unknown function (DUF2950)
MRVHTQPGGEIDYVVRGNMIGGFALVAYQHFRLDDILVNWRTTDIALK